MRILALLVTLGCGWLLTTAAPAVTAAGSAPETAASPATLDDLGPAPAFTLETYEGDEVSLAQYLTEGPVVIEFWATWCAPCRKALPHMQVIFEKYREQGLTVLAISQDDPRSQPKIGPYVTANKFTFPILLDGDKKVARQYRMTAPPATFLVTPEGRVVSLHRGYRNGDEKLLEAEIEALFAQLAAGENP